MRVRVRTKVAIVSRLLNSWGMGYLSDLSEISQKEVSYGDQVV